MWVRLKKQIHVREYFVTIRLAIAALNLVPELKTFRIAKFRQQSVLLHAPGRQSSVEIVN
jgi:hypothetical protein